MSSTNETYTENGAITLESSNDPRLDLFFKTVRNLGGKLPRDTGVPDDDFYNDVTGEAVLFIDQCLKRLPRFYSEIFF